MEFKSVVPWGRSFREYREMFSLSDSDLKKRILGCSDGPASFNAELSKSGGSVKSVDPTYAFTEEQFRRRVSEVYDEVMHQVRLDKDRFVWKSITTLEELGDVRMAAMNTFMADFELGKQQGRYVEGALPELPFGDGQFELALCSHFLFLYSEHVNLDDHIIYLKELCRVANEVRVYPLLTLKGEVSPHLNAVMAVFENSGIDLSIQSVEYQFQKGATHMMVLRSC